MPDPSPLAPDATRARLKRVSQKLAHGPLAAAAGLESTAAAPAAGLTDPNLADYADRTRDDLNRIVATLFDGAPDLHRLADEIAARGRAAMDVARSPDAVARFAAAPAMLGDLEAIVRTDGSRPTFLVRHGRVDLDSSPVGTWKRAIDREATPLAAALACVGRINDPSDTEAGYAGTGILIGPDLILTNRHVLQAVAEPDGKGWVLKESVAIDFGHEFRGEASVRPRALRAVVFAGKDWIDDGKVAHAKLDLAAIALAPAPDGPGVTPLAVDQAPDWAGPGGPDVYLVGYPARPPFGAYGADLLERLFQQTFGCKRFAPGVTAGPAVAGAAAWTMAHDATTLGGNSGSVVLVAGRATAAAALHYGGRRLEPAENWGHVLGRVLDTPDAAGRVLRDVLGEHGVKYRDREVGRGGPGFELAGTSD